MRRRYASAPIACSRSALKTGFRISASISIAWTARSSWCWRRRARPILRSTCRFIRAGGTSSINGDDRWAAVADQTGWPDRAARARAEFDLAIVSVFLDAGAGPSWRYRDPKTGSAIGRSEGLGLASLAMFAGGAFSADPREPLRVDADVLANLAVADLERGMQVSDANPLVGIDGRADLLRRLGRLVASKPDIFGRLRHAAARRPVSTGLRCWPTIGKLPAPTILTELLQQLGTDLAVAADAGRDRARRLLAASDADDRRMRPAVWCRCTSCRNGWPIR